MITASGSHPTLAAQAGAGDEGGERVQGVWGLAVLCLLKLEGGYAESAIACGGDALTHDG